MINRGLILLRGNKWISCIENASLNCNIYATGCVKPSNRAGLRNWLREANRYTQPY